MPGAPTITTADGGVNASPSVPLLSPLFTAAFSGIPQCLFIIDPTVEMLAPLHALKKIQEANGGAHQFGGDQKLLESKLQELRQQRRDYVALHGRSANVAELDQRIGRMSRALHPLLIEFNPTAHQIVAAIPQSPGNALVVVLDDDACQKLLLTLPGDSVRYLATTLARGFRGEPLYPQWRCHASTVITTHPRLSIVIAANRETIAALMSAPLLLEVGLAEEMIPLDQADCAEQKTYGLTNLLPSLIEERYLHAGGPLNAPDGFTHVDAADRRRKRLEDALKRWDALVGGGTSPERIAGAFARVESLRADLLAIRHRETLKEEEANMLEKLRSKGTWSIRELARKYPTGKQPKSYLEPILARLVAKGSVGVGREGRYYAVPGEGDESSPLSVLTC